MHSYLADCARRPFRPGKHDCALFVAGAVDAMTGVDPAAEWRDQYRSLKRGREILAEAGVTDMVEIAAARFPEIEPIFAQEGDVAVVDGDDGPAFGLVQGPMIYVLRPDGMGFVPLTDAKRAFRV